MQRTSSRCRWGRRYVRRIAHRPILVPVLLAVATACVAASGAQSNEIDWPVTGGEPGNSRYSPLTQIDRKNVKQLQVAWVHHTGDASPEGRTQIQATPIVVHGILYATSPTLQVFALRAGTGEERWRV